MFSPLLTNTWPWTWGGTKNEAASLSKAPLQYNKSQAAPLKCCGFPFSSELLCYHVWENTRRRHNSFLWNIQVTVSQVTDEQKGWPGRKGKWFKGCVSICWDIKEDEFKEWQLRRSAALKSFSVFFLLDLCGTVASCFWSSRFRAHQPVVWESRPLLSQHRRRVVWPQLQPLN